MYTTTNVTDWRDMCLHGSYDVATEPLQILKKVQTNIAISTRVMSFTKQHMLCDCNGNNIQMLDIAPVISCV